MPRLLKNWIENEVLHLLNHPPPPSLQNLHSSSPHINNTHTNHTQTITSRRNSSSSLTSSSSLLKINRYKINKNNYYSDILQINSFKLLMILNVYLEEGILIVCDLNIKIALFLPLEERIKFSLITPYTLIIPERYYFSTFLQSNFSSNFKLLDELDVGFPIVMICTSMKIKSGYIHQNLKVRTDINQVK